MRDESIFNVSNFVLVRTYIRVTAGLLNTNSSAPLIMVHGRFITGLCGVHFPRIYGGGPFKKCSATATWAFDKYPVGSLFFPITCGSGDRSRRTRTWAGYGEPFSTLLGRFGSIQA